MKRNHKNWLLQKRHKLMTKNDKNLQTLGEKTNKMWKVSVKMTRTYKKRHKNK